MRLSTWRVAQPRQERCLAALDRYLDDPSAEHLAALRNAYLAVPEHLRAVPAWRSGCEGHPSAHPAHSRRRPA